jgi:hypothetical protein
MKKPQTRLAHSTRLALARETVHRLDREELGAAQGAYNYSTGAICHTYTKVSCA